MDDGCLDFGAEVLRREGLGEGLRKDDAAHGAEEIVVRLGGPLAVVVSSLLWLLLGSLLLGSLLWRLWRLLRWLVVVVPLGSRRGDRRREVGVLGSEEGLPELAGLRRVGAVGSVELLAVVDDAADVGLEFVDVDVDASDLRPYRPEVHGFLDALRVARGHGVRHGIREDHVRVGLLHRLPALVQLLLELRRRVPVLMLLLLRRRRRSRRGPRRSRRGGCTLLLRQLRRRRRKGVGVGEGLVAAGDGGAELAEGGLVVLPREEDGVGGHRDSSEGREALSRGAGRRIQVQHDVDHESRPEVGVVFIIIIIPVVTEEAEFGDDLDDALQEAKVVEGRHFDDGRQAAPGVDVTRRPEGRARQQLRVVHGALLSLFSSKRGGGG
mmetsp:Transcript_8658/g.28352  ORF Transcript_8658/g.28352 Transcript_8658/m.28352 type:complete len:381 (+) Transcript_8658:444-1586(+)